jgi:hypothetical protein
LLPPVPSARRRLLRKHTRVEWWLAAGWVGDKVLVNFTLFLSAEDHMINTRRAGPSPLLKLSRAFPQGFIYRSQARRHERTRNGRAFASISHVHSPPGRRPQRLNRKMVSCRVQFLPRRFYFQRSNVGGAMAVCSGPTIVADPHGGALDHLQLTQ